MKRTLRSLEKKEIRAGLHVIINHNPHEAGAEGILGRITKYRPGEGFAGCDLVDVEYKHPTTDVISNMPFSLEKLNPAEPEILEAAAKRFDEMAAELRKLARQSISLPE